MKIRIRFRKYGVMKFVGHLDIMRYFQKAMRRAGIDIRYSEGFSPHQIMSFAAPLGVGITSDGEYLDIEVNSSHSSAEAIRALNGTMVEGMEIVSYIRLPDDAKTAMSIVAAADYDLVYDTAREKAAAAGGHAAEKTADSGKEDAPEHLTVPLTAAELTAAIAEHFTGRSAATVTKKTKKGERILDLKPLVYELHATEQDGLPGLYVKLSTGSQDNVKPELVLEYLLHAMERPFDPAAVRIHRKNVYARTADGTGFLSLDRMGENIV